MVEDSSDRRTHQTSPIYPADQCIAMHFGKGGTRGLLIGTLLFARILKPNHVLARLPGNEQVQVAVEVQIDRSDVGGRLVTAHKVTRESPVAVVLELHCLSIAISPRGGVDVVVAIQIYDHQRLWFQQQFVDHMLFPSGSLKPDHTATMSARGNEDELSGSCHQRLGFWPGRRRRNSRVN